VQTASPIIVRRQRAVARGVFLALLATFSAACPTLVYAGNDAAPDAVYEVWDQHWTLNADGSTSYHFRQHVRLNNDRTYRTFADPRITYNVDTDKLEIINARVKRVDGSYVELADYSHVKVSPDATAGWPAFGSIRQHLLVMSGIEAGCVVELEYQITSEPGTKPYLAGDVRLDDRYPVQQRSIAITTPKEIQVRTSFSGMGTDRAAESYAPDVETAADAITLRWTFSDLPAVPVEDQAPPWQTRCARLAFTSCGSAEKWVRSTLEQVSDAADASDVAKKLADRWAEDGSSPSTRLQDIQEKLAARYNFVNCDPSCRPPHLRPASQTLAVNYGTPAEAAAAFLALARAAELSVRPGVLVDDDVWNDRVPQRAFVQAFVVLLDTGGTAEIWDARYGRIQRAADRAGCRVLSYSPSGEIDKLVLPPWDNADDSRCRISGQLSIDDDGHCVGELAIHTTGLFVSPNELSATDDQKSRARGLLGHLLPGVDTEEFSVTSLSPTTFNATVEVASSKPLKDASGCFRWQLAQDGPFLAEIPMPLNHSRRISPVRLTGAFDEVIDLMIEWPEDWRTEARPGELTHVTGDWGSIEQNISVDKGRMTLKRHTHIAQRELSAEAFLTLRRPINELRSEHARTLLLKPN